MAHPDGRTHSYHSYQESLPLRIPSSNPATDAIAARNGSLTLHCQRSSIGRSCFRTFAEPLDITTGDTTSRHHGLHPPSARLLKSKILSFTPRRLRSRLLSSRFLDSRPTPMSGHGFPDPEPWYMILGMSTRSGKSSFGPVPGSCEFFFVFLLPFVAAILFYVPRRSSVLGEQLRNKINRISFGPKCQIDVSVPPRKALFMLIPHRPSCSNSPTCMVPACATPALRGGLSSAIRTPTRRRGRGCKTVEALAC